MRALYGAQHALRCMFFRRCARRCDLCTYVEPRAKVVFHCGFSIVCAATHDVYVSAFDIGLLLCGVTAKATSTLKYS